MKKLKRTVNGKFYALLVQFSDDDINKLASCDFEGRHYREGERMYPKNHCSKCFCTKNFNNKTSVAENKSCFKIDCGIALTKTTRLSEGCIPVYIKTDDCCPIGCELQISALEVFGFNFIIFRALSG